MNGPLSAWLGRFFVGVPRSLRIADGSPCLLERGVPARLPPDEFNGRARPGTTGLPAPSRLRTSTPCGRLTDRHETFW